MITIKFPWRLLPSNRSISSLYSLQRLMIYVRQHTWMYFEITADQLRKYSLSIISEIVIYINIRNYTIQDKLLGEPQRNTGIKDGENFSLQVPTPGHIDRLHC